MKPPPPALILTLVGAFLTTYGFNSTSRLYTTELSARKKLDEWKVLLDQKLPKGFPDLVKLFKVGQKTFEEQKQAEETSSSESDDESDEELPKKSSKGTKARQKALGKADDTSIDGGDESLVSDDSGDSDEEMEDAPPAAKVTTKSSTVSKREISSSSTSSSDSDADDEKEPAGVQVAPTKYPVAPTSNIAVQKLKHKASPKAEKPTKIEVRGRGRSGAVELSSSEESSSEDSSEEIDFTGGTDAAKPKVATAVLQLKSDGDNSPSSSDLSSSSGPDSSSPVKALVNSAINAIVAAGDNARHGSSSSETVKGTSDQKATTTETSVSSSSSDPEASSSEPTKESLVVEDPPPKSSKTKSTKRKHNDESEDAPVSKKQAHEEKKTNAPFERVPKDTPVDSRFTNKYKSYDYADRAYQDLSVTKGKGFTKEKNKKKRGSYRGGAIDVGGGKGIKFED